MDTDFLLKELILWEVKPFYNAAMRYMRSPHASTTSRNEAFCHARRHEPQLGRLGDINNMVEQVNEFGDVLCDCKKGCLRVLAGGAATLRSLCWRYLTEAAANELQLQGEDEDVDLETVNGSSQVRMKKTQVQLSSVDEGYKAKLSAFVIKDLSSASTKIDWNLMKDRWDHMKKIPFPTASRKGGIDMLIGLTGDTMSLFLPEETIQGPPGDPVAVKTPLGWTAFGPVSGAEMESIKTLRTHIRSKLKVENQEEIKAMREMTELEVIGVREQKEKILSVEDKEAMKKVEKMKHEGGRYEVNVPWRNDEPNLSGNFGYALSRLRKTEENMKKSKDEAMEKKYV
ncbi:hypothetical protein FJT64_008187 [Amphibalanus amphitrite]|uniref:Uncharacterized protein n=1 Tax=Amphibalanus amphitrite TaxID=1232801 RepID=A0A6A4VXG7_AMPAM|nr:hypothetical protein FJT64_008187 [Amphibalanus amphitrite]